MCYGVVDRLESEDMGMEQKHYKGRLGDFWYDPEQWVILMKYTEVGAFDILQYCGRESDGDKIVIPEGVVNTSYMFSHKSLTKCPKIPMGVHTADYMFEENPSLVLGAALPYQLRSASFMYKNCRSLLAGSDMPDTLVNASYMYDGCYSLQQPVRLSEGLQYMQGLYRNCRSLKAKNETLPASVLDNSNWLYGCRQVEQKEHPKMY